MEIFQIVIIAFVSAILALLFKKQNPEFGMYITLAAGIIIFFMIVGNLQIVINTLKDISEKINLNSTYIKIIFKIIGISYITEFSSQMCKDMGYSAIGFKIEFAGKILILVVSLPILMTLLNLITNLLA